VKRNADFGSLSSSLRPSSFALLSSLLSFCLLRSQLWTPMKRPSGAWSALVTMLRLGKGGINIRSCGLLGGSDEGPRLLRPKDEKNVSLSPNSAESDHRREPYP
jgi:hypothetical protein